MVPSSERLSQAGSRGCWASPSRSSATKSCRRNSSAAAPQRGPPSRPPRSPPQSIGDDLGGSNLHLTLLTDRVTSNIGATYLPSASKFAVMHNRSPAIHVVRCGPGPRQTTGFDHAWRWYPDDRSAVLAGWHL